MIITRDDAVTLHHIFKEFGHIYSANRIMDRFNENKLSELPLDKIYEIFEVNTLSNSKLQDSVLTFFEKNKNFNLVSLYEEKLNTHCWNSDIFLAYNRAIKNEKYYPKDHSIIFNAINNQSCSNNKTFWGMISLASLCKDDKYSIDSFSLILERKKRTKELPLLDLDKIQKIWNQRFKNVSNIELISPDSYSKIQSYFKIASESKNKDFLSTEEGFYLKQNIDINLLSQSNKFSLNKNREALQIFFNAFENYSSSVSAKDLLSITNFSFNFNEKAVLMFSYSDSSKKELINSLSCDLLDYALSKQNKNTLKGGISIPLESREKFFTAFLSHYALQSSLSKKNDSILVKKIKI